MKNLGMNAQDIQVIGIIRQFEQLNNRRHQEPPAVRSERRDPSSDLFERQAAEKW